MHLEIYFNPPKERERPEVHYWMSSVRSDDIIFIETINKIYLEL